MRLILLHLLVFLFPMEILLNPYHATPSSNSNLYPLILVPGSGGNQLEARLTDKYKPSSILCSRRARKATSDGRWFRIWFDFTVLVPFLTRCFAERMTLRYDPAVDDYRNAPGVETRTPHFGSTKGLQCLDPDFKHITEYMATLVRNLEDIGYKDGENLFGAPYDFRYGLAPEGRPCQVGTRYLADLKDLIEKASSSNNGKPVIVLSHSLGGLFALSLLNRNPLSWRKKYIKHLVTLSAPWGGTVQEMLTFASGYTLGIPIVDPLQVRAEQRSSESNLWLMPAPKVFDKRPLVIAAGNKSYTSRDVAEFLGDIGFPEGVRPYETRVLPMQGGWAAPGVPVTCIVGSGVKTPETLFYGKGGFDRQPDVVYGDGDGTVNMASLVALEGEWKSSVEGQQQSLKVTRVPMVSHTSILKEAEALRVVMGEIYGINSQLLELV